MSRRAVERLTVGLSCLILGAARAMGCVSGCAHKTTPHPRQEFRAVKAGRGVSSWSGASSRLKLRRRAAPGCGRAGTTAISSALPSTMRRRARPQWRRSRRAGDANKLAPHWRVQWRRCSRMGGARKKPRARLLCAGGAQVIRDEPQKGRRCEQISFMRCKSPTEWTPSAGLTASTLGAIPTRPMAAKSLRGS
jgi:hypothetical protein